MEILDPFVARGKFFQLMFCRCLKVAKFADIFCIERTLPTKQKMTRSRKFPSFTNWRSIFSRFLSEKHLDINIRQILSWPFVTFRFVGKIKHFFWGVKVHLLTYWQLKEHITRGKFWHISLSKQSFSNLDPFIFSKLWFTSIWANFWRIFFINLPLGWVKPTSTSVKVELDSRNRQQSKARIRSVLDRFWRFVSKTIFDSKWIWRCRYFSIIEGNFGMIPISFNCLCTCLFSNFWRNLRDNCYNLIALVTSDIDKK